MTSFKTLGAIAAAAFLFAAGPVQSAPVQLTWTSIVSSTGDALPPGVTLGDSFTLTLTVDNGGFTLASQTWSLGDLVSVTVNVDGGAYVATMTGGATGSSSFQTDASGDVTSVGNWTAFPVLDYVDSAGNTDENSGAGGWFVNGFNQVFGIFAPISSPGTSLIAISSPAVAGNQDPVNWQATLVDGTVPEPATLGLVLASLGLVAGLRRRATVR